MNTISFEVNNQRKMKLVQRQHDGVTLLVIEDQHGDHESIPDEEAFISPRRLRDAHQLLPRLPARGQAHLVRR